MTGGGFIGARSAAAGGSAISADELATVLDEEADVAGRLLAVTQAIVERFAAGAPVEVRNEAIIRLAGWLRASPPADIAPTGVGSIRFFWKSDNDRAALRKSGAAGLLAPWRRPRALVVG